jgi:hypothetical protein
MRLRRLNSWMAVTIASRFVFALVNRIASARSLSGILTVVFMIPFYRMEYSLSMTIGILRAGRVRVTPGLLDRRSAAAGTDRSAVCRAAAARLVSWRSRSSLASHVDEIIVNSNRMMGHQQASPASSARVTRSLTVASPLGQDPQTATRHRSHRTVWLAGSVIAVRSAWRARARNRLNSVLARSSGIPPHSARRWCGKTLTNPAPITWIVGRPGGDRWRAPLLRPSLPRRSL